jgi:hypothetical protein
MVITIDPLIHFAVMVMTIITKKPKSLQTVPPILDEATGPNLSHALDPPWHRQYYHSGPAVPDSPGYAQGQYVPPPNLFTPKPHPQPQPQPQPAQQSQSSSGDALVTGIIIGDMVARANMGAPVFLPLLKHASAEVRAAAASALGGCPCCQ